MDGKPRFSSWLLGLPAGSWLRSFDTEKTLKSHRKRGGDLGVRDDIWGTDSGLREVRDERNESG